MKNQYIVKSLPCRIENSDAVRKSFADSGLNDPSIIMNAAHVEFNDKSLDNVCFVKVNSSPAVREHLTPNFYIHEALSHGVNESSWLRLDPDEKLKLDEQDSLVRNSTLTSPKTIIELSPKLYVDSLHENNRNRRDFSSVYNDQDKEFDNNKVTISDSITVSRDPIPDNELENKKYVDGSTGDGTILRFNQTLDN